MRVAIAACRSAAGGSAGDDSLYPDPDRGLLVEALAAAGAEVAVAAWDAPGVDWERFDVVAVRSTWDSVDRPGEFLRWARRVAAGGAALVNPLAAIEWALDKRYLRELAAAGVPVVPTQWVTAGSSAFEVGAAFDVVVKPSVSGGGRRTARYRAGEVEAARAHVRRLVADGYTAMVQEYVEDVEGDGDGDGDGELKLVFVGGAYSHAVRVGPLLPPGRVLSARPWEDEPVSVEATVPGAAAVELAASAYAAAEAAVGVGLAYGRVDLFGGLVNEVELIDPLLMLRFAPDGTAVARRLAAAVLGT